MKKLLPLLFAVCLEPALAQTTPNYDGIRLEQASDYRAADSSALTAAAYLLSTPSGKDDRARLQSLQFLIKWMSGTPDYSFTLDEVAAKIIKGNDDLLGLYMAAMVQYCLENKASAEDQRGVKLNAVRLLLAYCENTANGVKMTRQLQKLSDANQKGNLEAAL